MIVILQLLLWLAHTHTQRFGIFLCTIYSSVLDMHACPSLRVQRRANQMGPPRNPAVCVCAREY